MASMTSVDGNMSDQNESGRENERKGAHQMVDLGILVGRSSPDGDDALERGQVFEVWRWISKSKV